MPLRVRMTGEGLRLTGDPTAAALLSQPDEFLLQTEDGEPLADDVGENLAREPDDAG